MSRVLLCAQKKAIEFFRTRKALLLLIAIVGLGACQAIILGAAVRLPTASFSSILYGSYNVFVQFLPVALATVLAASVCGEKENRVWFFYLTKPIRKSEIILAKILFYGFAVLTIALFAWLVTIGVTWLIARPDYLDWTRLLYVGVIVLGVTFMVVNLELMISSLAGKSSIAALLIVVAWIGLILIDVVLPDGFGKGIVAPYAAYSVQTNTVAQLLEIVPEQSCASCPLPTVPRAFEVLKVSLLPVLEGGLLGLLALVLVKAD